MAALYDLKFKVIPISLEYRSIGKVIYQIELLFKALRPPSWSHSRFPTELNCILYLIDGIVEKMARLIEGYESPYGMELLSSVHWLADNEKHYPIEKVIEALRGWSEHKNLFDEISIRAAYQRLSEDGLIN